jgi:hypothetical protein
MFYFQYVMKTEKLTGFIKQIQPTNHIILFYDDSETKRRILYDYISDGLAKGKGIIYICSDESPDEVRDGLISYGIDVEPNERSEVLLIKNFEWYIEKGNADTLKIINRMNDAYRKFSEKGLGMRITGEMSCFFKQNKVRELLRYEYALHKVLTIPIDAICAYNLQSIVDAGYTDVIMPLVRAHGKAIFTAQGGSIIVEPNDVEDTDLERLLEIEI